MKVQVFHNAKLIVAILGILLLPCLRSAESLTVTHYGSANVIRDMALHDGHLWCATGDGLVRCNVVTGDYLRITAADGLPSNDVTAVAIAPEGVVWAGTGAGLVRYDGVAFETWDAAGTFALENITSVAVDADGGVWVASLKGLVVLRGTEWTRESYLRVNDLAIGDDGSLWSVEVSVLRRYHDNEWSTFFSGEEVEQVSVAPDGAVWVLKDGVFRFDGNDWASINYPLRSPESISAGPGVSGWVANYQYLSHLEDGEWVHHTNDVEEEIVTMAYSGDGGVWCGSSAGLYHLDGADLTPYRIYDTLSDKCGRELMVAPGGALWYAGRYGLSRYRDGAWESWDETRGLPNANNHEIAAGPAGEVWMASYYELMEQNEQGDFYTDVTLARFDGAGWETVALPDSIDLVFGLVVDNDGLPWIMTRFRYDVGTYRYTLRHFNGSGWESFGGGSTKTMYYDPVEDAIWYGSKDRVYKLRDGERTWIETWSSAGWINDIRVRDGVLFIAAPIVGRYVDDQWETYGGEEAEFFDIDETGRVWALNRDGVVLRSIRESFERIVNVGMNDAFARTPDGAIWAADSRDGLVRVTEFPPVRLGYLAGYVMEDNQPVAGATVTLTPGGQSTVTSADGSYSVNDIEPAYYDVTFDFFSSHHQEVVSHTVEDFFIGDEEATGLKFWYAKGDVGVEDKTPIAFGLEIPYPNPFNAVVTIPFTTAENGRVSLRVYDITGRMVSDLVKRHLPAGRHTVQWDGTEKSGGTVASGVYFMRLTNEGLAAVRRVMYVK